MTETGTTRTSALVHNRRVAFMMIGALLLLALSQLYENPFWVCPAHAAGTPEVALPCHLNGKLFAHLALEGAFALIIATAVTVGIERQARVAELDAHEHMRRSIAENVFRGVFAKDLPSAYVDSVIDHVLKIDVIRDHQKVIDRIDLDPDNESKLRLSRKVLFCARNVREGPVSHPVVFTYHSDDIGDLERSGVESLTIDGTRYTKAQLAKHRKVDLDLGQIHYEIPYEFAKDGQAQVEYDVTIYKQKSDSEVWGALAPCMRLDYSVRFGCPIKRLGMTERSITPAKRLVLDLKAGMGDWQIDGPFLRDNSLTVWWEVE